MASSARAHTKGHGLGRPARLTVVDFSLPSSFKRLWVLDLVSGAVLLHERVAHGARSGDELRARSFSDAPRSKQSSLGLFEVNEVGTGRRVGPTILLDGLEPGWNGRARARQVVIHGAEYASNRSYRLNGFTGRSSGCFSVRPGIIATLQREIGGGSLLFAYYPDSKYLATSAHAAPPSTEPSSAARRRPRRGARRTATLGRRASSGREPATPR